VANITSELEGPEMTPMLVESLKTAIISHYKSTLILLKKNADPSLLEVIDKRFCDMEDSATILGKVGHACS